jgi:hypothetical protein
VSEPCQVTVNVSVVVYKPGTDDKGGPKFDVVMVDKESFVSQLESVEPYECSQEIKQLLQKTKETWPSLISPNLQKSIQN